MKLQPATSSPALTGRTCATQYPLNAIVHHHKIKDETSRFFLMTSYHNPSQRLIKCTDLKALGFCSTSFHIWQPHTANHHNSYIRSLSPPTGRPSRGCGLPLVCEIRSSTSHSKTSCQVSKTTCHPYTNGQSSRRTPSSH